MGAVNLVNVTSILMQNGGWQLDAVGSATANDINLFMCWELFDDA